jgi:hypothetical protein
MIGLMKRHMVDHAHASDLPAFSPPASTGTLSIQGKGVKVAGKRPSKLLLSTVQHMELQEDTCGTVSCTPAWPQPLTKDSEHPHDRPKEGLNNDKEQRTLAVLNALLVILGAGTRHQVGQGRSPV